MVNIIEGDLLNPTGRFALIAARFNNLVVDQLLSGALEAFRRHGVPESQLDVIRVPGSYEIPLVAQKLGKSGQYAAIVCLGCVIRGDTDHYDYVAGAAANGIAHAGPATGVPVIFGVLTCENLEQALHRVGGKAGNKGYEAALAAIEMASLMKKLA
jgi:6,7-dimethyl-8-ribityllumazine synthase